MPLSYFIPILVQTDLVLYKEMGIDPPNLQGNSMDKMLYWVSQLEKNGLILCVNRIMELCNFSCAFYIYLVRLLSLTLA